jgi:hypothetical protein
VSKRRCDRCGAEDTLQRVAEDLLCGWCYGQWWKLFNGEDEDGLLRHGPATRFLALPAGTPGRRGARSLARAFGLDRKQIQAHEKRCLGGEEQRAS